MRLEVSKEELKEIVDLLENELNVETYGKYTSEHPLFTLFTRCARAYYSDMASNALKRAQVYQGSSDGSYKAALDYHGYNVAMSYLERV